MRIFLITLGVCIVTSILLWNFGLAQRIWPAHPLWCTTLLSMFSGILADQLLKQEARSRGPK